MIFSILKLSMTMAAGDVWPLQNITIFDPIHDDLPKHINSKSRLAQTHCVVSKVDHVGIPANLFKRLLDEGV